MLNVRGFGSGYVGLGTDAPYRAAGEPNLPARTVTERLLTNPRSALLLFQSLGYRCFEFFTA